MGPKLAAAASDWQFPHGSVVTLRGAPPGATHGSLLVLRGRYCVSVNVHLTETEHLPHAVHQVILLGQQSRSVFEHADADDSTRRLVKDTHSNIAVGQAKRFVYERCVATAT